MCYNVTYLFCVSVGGIVWGLAVNPEEDKLYSSEASDRKIVVTSLDGNRKSTLIDCIDQPYSLAVDLNRR